MLRISFLYPMESLYAAAEYGKGQINVMTIPWIRGKILDALKTET